MIRTGRLRSRHLLVALGLLTILLAAGCSKKVTTSVNDQPLPGETDPAAKGHYIDHTVADGETLAQVADNYYGDPGRADRIARDNGLTDPGRIIPGSLLRLNFSDDEWASARQRSAALAPYNKGVDLLANERLAEAEKQFGLALDTAPDLVAARYNLALVQLKRGRTEEALILLEELTALRPTDTDFLFAQGNALFQATRFDDAATQFQAALTLDPQLKRAAFGLARSLQEGGHRDQAIAAWQRYLVLDGSSSWATAARRNLEKLQNDDGS